MANNENFYYMRLRAPVLAWLPVTFWLCSPFVLVGLVLGTIRFSRIWPLYLLVACCLLPLLIFYVLGRFRLPLTAATLPFAALTVVEIGRWAGSRRYRLGILTAAMVLIVATWTGRSTQSQPLIRPADWLAPFHVRYQGEIQAALDAGDRPRAIAGFLELFRYEPDLSQLTSPSDRPAIEILAKMHTDCASLLRDSGQVELAREHSDKAAVLLRALRFVGGRYAP